LKLTSLSPSQAPSTGVDRSNKAAPLPETEKGDAIEGMNASGGGLSGATQDTNIAEKEAAEKN
jgi:hypothetical protein